MKNASTKAIQLTERDVKIIKFINTFGFCEMPHLDKKFNLKKPRNYQLLNRLQDAGLVKHERVFYGKHGIFRVTEKGAKLTDLPALKRLPLASYTHNTVLTDVYLALTSQFPDAQWLSERLLMQEKHGSGVGKHGHLPDGVLVFPDGKRIAIEVELSNKSKYRLERILKGYGADFSYKEVWYYCADSVVASISKLATELPFIKIYRLRDLGL